MQTFSVTMPDGTVLKGIPEGTTKKQIMARYQGKVPQRPSTVSPEAPMSREGMSNPFSYADQNYQGQVKNETSFFDGVLKGATDTINNIDSHLTRMTGDSANRKRYPQGKHIEGYSSKPGPSLKQRQQKVDQYFQEREGQGVVPSAIGEFTGQLAGSIPAVMLAGSNPYAIGAAGGFAMSDADNNVDLAADMALSSVMNKGADKVLDVVGGFIAPKLSRGVDKLKEMGVDTTIGQTLGNGWKRAEDTLMSLPIVGGKVAERRGEASQQWLRGVYNKVLSPLKKSLPDDMPLDERAYTHVSKTISKAYDEVLPKVKVKADEQLAKSLGNAVELSKSADGNQAAMKKLQNIILNRVYPSFSKAGQMTGTAWKQLDAELGELIRVAKKSDKTSDIGYLRGLQEVRTQLRGAVERSNAGTEVGAALKAVDKAYASKMPLRRAVKKDNTSYGEFTPQQLLTASRTGVDDETLARGNQLLMDEAFAGKQLGSIVNNSGTAERLMMGAGLAGAGGGLGYMADQSDGGMMGAGLGTAAALMAPRLAYSKAGQKALRGFFGSKRPAAFKAGRKYLDQARPYLGISFATQAPTINQNL